MFSILTFLLYISFVFCNDLEPLIQIKYGSIKGVTSISTNGRNYASFKSIPYAKPPIGEYRFKDPQPVDPWVGVWNASQYLSHCLQYEPFLKGITGSEDCLFVNVYTPKLNPATLMPVVIFIPGGAFMYGGSSVYDPSHLMDRDMVVVSLNYRLGPLGFLSTGDEVIPGNGGLKDQAFALHWIQDNIKAFGGDPDQVTLTGSSAGGASVHYQYLTTLSKGTFQRGIAFSGSAFAPWTHQMKPIQKAKRLASLVGCPTDGSTKLRDCLLKRPADMLVNAQIEMLEWKIHMFTPFLPTIEVPSDGAFLTKYPYDAVIAGQTQRLPLITSITSEEGLYPAACYQREPNVLSELESRWDELASHIFEYNDTLSIEKRKEVAAKIKKHYLDGKPVSQETFGRLVQALGDRLFGADVGRLGQIHAETTEQPTYVYRYSFRGKQSGSNYMSGKDDNYGTSHGDDILQLFVFLWNSQQPEEIRVRETLIDIVYSFAKTGIPKVNNGPEWLKVEPGSAELNYLDIAGAADIEMKSSADFGQISFWDGLGFTENEKYNRNIRDEL